jgi:hypothetical protein
MIDSGEVMCCFCGDWLPAQDAVILVAYPTRDRHDTQTLYSHKRCLADALHKDFPGHPDLYD